MNPARQNTKSLSTGREQTNTPKPTDDLETTAHKLSVLANLVTTGNSLALHTGLTHSTAPTRRDSESLARSQMSSPEIESYDHWKNRLVPLPTFDWVVNKAPLPSAAASTARKFTRRAAAMERAWSVPAGTASAEHAAWLTFNMAYALPLVTAVGRVLVAEEQGRADPLAHLGPMDVAEVETLRSLVGTAEKVRAGELQRVKRLNKSALESVAVLNKRVRELQGMGMDMGQGQGEVTVKVEDEHEFEV